MGIITNEDDFKVLWICDYCHSLFLFRSDTEIHIQKAGHNHLTAYDFDTGHMLREKGIGEDD